MRKKKKSGRASAKNLGLASEVRHDAFLCLCPKSLSRNLGSLPFYFILLFLNSKAMPTRLFRFFLLVILISLFENVGIQQSELDWCAKLDSA